MICLWGNLSYRPEFYPNTYIIRIGKFLKYRISKSNLFYGNQFNFSLLEIVPLTRNIKAHLMMAFILFLQYKTRKIFVPDKPTVTRKLFISFLLFFFTYGSQNRVIFLKREHNLRRVYKSYFLSSTFGAFPSRYVISPKV